MDSMLEGLGIQPIDTYYKFNLLLPTERRGKILVHLYT